MLNDLVLKNRSYRRFDGSFPISPILLKELVGLARICPSSRNQQALKFACVHEESQNRLVFGTLAWAGYLKDWSGPVRNEQPTGYIIVLGDTRLGTRFDVDLGIASQTILLRAAESGLGGCMIASINKEELRTRLKIPDYLEILLVLALGKPTETVVIDTMKNGEIRYWRDDDQVHHVPKRDLDDLLIEV
ncbi:MAG TPA: nitroreductase [Bacteroidales bacterium]|nr:nitroreductase [Bacteroidales bacterium]